MAVDSTHSFVNISNYLTSGVYPVGSDKASKRSLHKREAYFTMDAGLFHYIGGKVKQRPRLVVQSEGEQLRLIKTIHHLGRDKTLSQLNE